MNNKTWNQAMWLLVTGACMAQAPTQMRTESLDEVVVSDTKFLQQREKSGKVIDVIKADDLSEWRGQSVAQVLSSVAGLEINGNQSAPGKNLGYYLRGGRNRQAVIYLDGMPVTDPSGINVEYDLRLLAADQVERIEILKGASSTLYGSGAATGVINITLKNPSKKALAFVGSVSFGTLTTAKTANYRPGDTRQNLQLSGSKGAWNYLATLNTQQANGFSEAVPFSPTETPEADRMARINTLVKTGFSAGNHFSLQLLGTADRLLNAFDDTYNGVSTSDNPYNMSYINQYRVGINPRWQHKKGEIVLALGGTNTQRIAHQWNSWISSVDTYRYVGRQTSADLYAKHTLNKALYVVGGLQYQFMDMSSDSPYGNMLHEQSRFILADPYATFVADYKGFGLNAGGRLNTHSLYGQNWVYNINPFYHVPNTTLKVMVSLSTAYITPSLYQLFDAYSGNADLAPERNRTVELGAEASLAQKKIQLTAVLFQREENQSILYSDATYRYYNADGINKAKGMEVGFRFQPAVHWSLQANYTFNELDEALQRLNPKHKFNGRLAWARGRWSSQWQWQYADKRMDLYGYPGTSVSLDAYKINHLMGQYELLPGRCRVFAQVTNVFDEAFTEVIGYATQGRNYRLGLQLTW